jgi:hypothetical protein
VVKKRRPIVASVLIALLMAAVGAVLHAQDDRHAGTWKLNVEKSSFSPGPPLASQIRTYESYHERYRGEGVKATVETVDGEGNRTGGGYVAFFDGSSYPATDDPSVTTLSLLRVDASTFVATLKRGSRVVLTTRNVVSPDGKVMKLIERGTREDGQPVYNVQVYDKQEPSKH